MIKKSLIIFTLILSFLGMSRVNADTYELSYTDTLAYSCNFYVTDYDYLKELGYDDEVQELYNMLLDEYNKSYSSLYPYFYIDLQVLDGQNCNMISSFDKAEYLYMNMYLYSNAPSIHSYLIPDFDFSLLSSYTVSQSEYKTPYYTSYSGAELLNIHDNFYNPFAYLISNFDLVYEGEDSYKISGNTNLTINPGDVIKPMFTVDTAFQSGYTEINLNDYAYVALAPKEFYEDETVTTVYVKGQYCLTPVYNYGLRERNDVISGTKMQRCTVKYDDFTPVRTYLMKQDMQNHSIYYVKAYDTSFDNIIKVDNNVFDITYITEEEKNEPYVYIQGKYYPTIPYDKLTDTATKSEEEGYNSGVSCAVGDLNCMVENGAVLSFSDIFDKPLETLKGVWDSIKNVFNLIAELISLLPIEMQGFLYLSFMLLVIIGLIKMIF